MRNILHNDRHNLFSNAKHLNTNTSFYVICFVYYNVVFALFLSIIFNTYYLQVLIILYCSN